jgi:hypothetical protein
MTNQKYATNEHAKVGQKLALDFSNEYEVTEVLGMDEYAHVWMNVMVKYVGKREPTRWNTRCTLKPQLINRFYVREGA